MQFDEERVLEFDRISVADYLHARGVSEPFINWFWASACLAVMNVTLDECSAGALMRVFAQLIGRHEYHIGFAKCGLADVFAPMLERLPNQTTQVFCNTQVRLLEINEHRVSRVLLQNGQSVAPRFVVSAIEARALQKILPDAWQPMRPFDALSAFEPVPYVSTYVWFDRKLSEQKFWARVWSPHDLNCDFYDLSNIRPGVHRGSLIATNSIHCPGAHAMTDEQVIAATVREIGELIPETLTAKVLHARVHRVPMAIAKPAPGTERLRPHAVTPVKNLFLAGDWTRTLLPCSMESAVHSGLQAAELIWNSLGQPRTLLMSKAAPEGLTGWVSRVTA